MSDPNTPSPRNSTRSKSGRGLKIALALSLALNLLTLGLVGGAMLAIGPRDGGDAPGLRSLGLGPFVIALDRDDRTELRGRINPRDLRGDRLAVGQSLRDFQAALRSDPFDRSAAERALGQSRSSAEALQARGHIALIDQVQDMTAVERMALADRLQRALNRMARRGPARD